MMIITIVSREYRSDTRLLKVRGLFGETSNISVLDCFLPVFTHSTIRFTFKVSMKSSSLLPDILIFLRSSIELWALC